MPEYNLMNEKIKTDNLGNVINSQSLAPVPTIKTVTATPDNTNYNGLISGVTESVVNDYNTLNSKLTSAKNAQTNTGNDILNLMNEISGREAYAQYAREQTGVNKETDILNKYVTQLSDLNAQASSLNREAQAIPIQIQQNARGEGQTDRGVAPLEAGQQRLNALKALSIGQQSDIALAAATGSEIRLKAAKDKAQEIVNLKYKPLEDELALKQKQYDLNKDVLDFLDKKRSESLQIALNKEAQDLADRKEKDKAIQEMITQALAQGASPDTVNAAANAKSPLEAAKILGKFSGEYLKYEMLKEQILTQKEARKTERLQQAKYAADIKKINKETELLGDNTPNSIPPDRQAALDIILGSQNLSKEQKATITNSVKNGQDPFTVIKNQAKNIMGQTNATKLDNYETAKEQLVQVQSALSSYYSNGGKTDIFKGNYEKVINKLGEVKDPKLVEIATQIASSLQIYRNAVSGTAYSVQEGRDIASIFPGIDKSQGLNTAILNGRMKAFDTTIDSTYKNVLGNTYTALKPEGANAQSVDPNSPFAQALGTVNSVTTGTSILGGLNTDGTLNFNIPK